MSDKAPPAPDGCVYGPWWDEDIRKDGCWCYSDGKLSYAWLPSFSTWVATESAALRELLRLAKENDAKTAFIKKTIELYGTRDGPWNIPSDPGGWLSEARSLVGEPFTTHEEAMGETEE